MMRLYRLVLPLGILLSWALVSGLGLVDSLFLRSPRSVVEALATGLVEGPLLRDLIATARRSLSGFALSGLIGIPAGSLSRPDRAAGARYAAND